MGTNLCLSRLIHCKILCDGIENFSHSTQPGYSVANLEKFAPPNAPKTLGLINKGVHCDGVGPKISSFGSLSALLCGCVLREVKCLGPIIPITNFP